jgi:hypothetical protein
MNIDTIMNPTTPSAAQTKAAFRVVVAVTDTIREAGRVAEGPLYAMLCDRMDLQAFERMVTIIVGTKLVRREGHELVWQGPVIQ